MPTTLPRLRPVVSQAWTWPSGSTRTPPETPRPGDEIGAEQGRQRLGPPATLRAGLAGDAGQPRHQVALPAAGHRDHQLARHRRFRWRSVRGDAPRPGDAQQRQVERLVATGDRGVERRLAAHHHQAFVAVERVQRRDHQVGADVRRRGRAGAARPHLHARRRPRRCAVVADGVREELQRETRTSHAFTVARPRRRRGSAVRRGELVEPRRHEQAAVAGEPQRRRASPRRRRSAAACAPSRRPRRTRTRVTSASPPTAGPARSTAAVRTVGCTSG